MEEKKVKAGLLQKLDSPELWESMKEEHERFVEVSRLNIVELYSVHVHIVVHTKVRIHL